MLRIWEATAFARHSREGGSDVQEATSLDGQTFVCQEPRLRGNDELENHASSVTRNTSSIVVTPAIALMMPSSYIVRMPALRASCSSSPIPAWRMTARRSSSLMTMNSMIVVRPW